jgi:hypothetical protein
MSNRMSLLLAAAAVVVVAVGAGAAVADLFGRGRRINYPEWFKFARRPSANIRKVATQSAASKK